VIWARIGRIKRAVRRPVDPDHSSPASRARHLAGNRVCSRDDGVGHDEVNGLECHAVLDLVDGELDCADLHRAALDLAPSRHPLDRNPDAVGLADLFVIGASELVYVVDLGDVEGPALNRVPQLGVLRSRGAPCRSFLARRLESPQACRFLRALSARGRGAPMRLRTERERDCDPRPRGWLLHPLGVRMLRCHRADVELLVVAAADLDRGRVRRAGVAGIVMAGG
jgi:hypothetical protein